VLQKDKHLLCGPFLRRLESNQVNIWFVTFEQVNLEIKLKSRDAYVSCRQECDEIQLGARCFVHLVTLRVQDTDWPEAQHIGFELYLDDTQVDLSDLALPGQDNPGFIYRSKLKSVVQGSCRKPDHHSRDAFVGIDIRLKQDPQSRPDYLIMAGDQIYADDVAAPMLVAVQSLSKQLGLFTANHAGEFFTKEEMSWQNSINRRRSMLPKKQDQSRWQKFWHGEEIISSRYHDNHLIELSEFFACYLLTWSSCCWVMVMEDVDKASEHFLGEEQKLYKSEQKILQQYSYDLVTFERVMANMPCVMMFDDHDVTDDWNLSADWEYHVYNHDVTRHMIRDALVSYAVFQGWGNAPKRMQPLLDQIKQLSEVQDFASEELTQNIFDFNHWHYHIETQPNIVVLDTRTHRWRSETSLKNPSGLMDWERLEQLQKRLYQAETSVLVVSPAPVFGVKAIEVVQKGCEIVGKELLVDVENWMAHRGAANKLMNMLRHDKAPDEVIIMSGDVHYSFCFSAERRFSSSTDKIWQLTCSGFKNEFPQSLLKCFDYIDRTLYSEHSLLNIFTKRRKLSIDHHPLLLPGKDEDKLVKRHLHSQSAAGLVELNETGYLKSFQLITETGDLLPFQINDN